MNKNFIYLIIINITLFIFNLFLNNFIFVLLIILIDLIYIYKIYTKIIKIDKITNNILNGDYSLNLKDYKEGIISNLQNDIYKMTVKLNEYNKLLIKDKKDLLETLEDISHQIKTPITSMYMINDILLTESDENIRKEFLIKNKNQIERIEWLVLSLLKLSKLDNVKLKKEIIDFNDLINKSIEPIKVLLDVKDINLNISKKNIDINCDINWTKEAILNVVKNALEHTKDTISINCTTNPIYTEISIKDNGKGLSKSNMKHIFERFYKCSKKDSIGIGLNMTKKIMELQNGIVEVESNNGCIFKLKFYKN